MEGEVEEMARGDDKMVGGGGCARDGLCLGEPSGVLPVFLGGWLTVEGFAQHGLTITRQK